MADSLPYLGLTLKPAEATTFFNLGVAGLVGLGTILLTEGVKDKTGIPVRNLAIWSLAIGGVLALAIWDINRSAI